MKIVEIDRDGDEFIVTWCQGAQKPRTRSFADRTEAEKFGLSKMGKTGYMISTLDMTPEQLTAKRSLQK